MGKHKLPLKFWNPYYEIYRSLDLKEHWPAEDFLRSWEARDNLVFRYSFALLHDKAIQTILNYQPLVEIGAGNGYWAKVIREAGGDIIAYDKGVHDPETLHAPIQFWSEVLPGDETSVDPARTLLLVWPPYDTPMGYNALKLYGDRGGKTVIYVGEWDGCTADEAFHHLLNQSWREVQEVPIPQWLGVHDYLWVYERRETC